MSTSFLMKDCICSLSKWAFILKQQKVKVGILFSTSYSYSWTPVGFQNNCRFPYLVILSTQLVLGYLRWLREQSWQSAHSKRCEYQEVLLFTLTPHGKVNLLPAFGSLWTLVCFSRKLIFLKLSTQLLLPYTYANYITCRFLSVIIYIHIHEQCFLPLAVWLPLNLICIILRNWINCELAWKKINILSILTRKHWSITKNYFLK